MSQQEKQPCWIQCSCAESQAQQTKQVPDWVLKGNIIPVAFEGTSRIEGALLCPRCGSTNISVAAQNLLATTPDRTVNGLRVAFLCHSCENTQSARNPVSVLDLVNQDGKSYCKWEK